MNECEESNKMNDQRRQKEEVIRGISGILKTCLMHKKNTGCRKQKTLLTHKSWVVYLTFAIYTQFLLCALFFFSILFIVIYTLYSLKDSSKK